MLFKNVITWFDIPTKDFDRAIKFYSQLLGEPIEKSEHMNQELAFFPMEKDPTGVGGDIVPPSEQNKPSATGTRVYFSCEGRLDEALSKVEPAGGKILQPKFNIGDPGWIAIIQDSEGNTVGLHSSK